MTGSVLRPELPFDPVETSGSFAARLAFLHTGRDTARFLDDLGINVPSFRCGAVEAVSRLAHASGACPDALLRNTFRSERSGRAQTFRGETWSSSFVMRSTTRVCPACLGEDEVASQGLPSGAAHKDRFVWRLRPIMACPVHHVGLVTVEGAKHGLAMPNPAAFSAAPLMGGQPLSSPVPREPSRLERWVLDRVEGRPDAGGPWLAGQTLEQGTRASEMLGLMLRRGLTPNRKHVTPDDWAEVGSAGFEIACAGEEAVRGALDRIAAMSASVAGQAGPLAMYGRLYEWLASEHLVVHPGAIRGVLRDHILDRLPINPGEILLGERVAKRRLHSVLTLSQATGFPKPMLRDSFVERGLLPRNAGERAFHRLVIAADVAERACRDLFWHVPLSALPIYLRCSRTQADDLCRSGTLVPLAPQRASTTGGQPHFAKARLDRWLADVAEVTPVADKPVGGLEDLAAACASTGLTTSQALGAVLAGRVPSACRDPEQDGLSAVRLRAAELLPAR